MIRDTGNSGLFRRSNLSVVAEEFANCKTISFEPNTTLFFTTDNLEYIYYVEEGIITSNLKWENKKKKIYWNDKCLVNAFMLFLDNFNYEIQTTTTVKMKAMPTEQFKEALRKNKKLLIEVIKDDSYALLCYVKQLNLICFCDANERINQFYKDFYAYNADFKISQGTIAESLALHPVTVSKISNSKKEQKE